MFLNLPVTTAADNSDEDAELVTSAEDKAFDKVLINGLIKKLIDRNVPYELVSILFTWFSCLRCCVSWNCLVSTPFPIMCGVRQGGILSPFLFAGWGLVGRASRADTADNNNNNDRPTSGTDDDAGGVESARMRSSRKCARKMCIPAT